MKQRIGVYICHCGGNISDYVDVEQLSKLIEKENGVVVSKDVMFACADSNQKEMIQDIQEKQLDAIVVASCSPKLHTHTFRNVAIRAGINQYNYTQVNIREQCSWAHSDMPAEATVKAFGLVRAGLNRVSHSEALENIEIKSHRAVAVIGAGVAGMRAAIDLARMGNHVYLIEKENSVGGRVAQAGKLFMTGEDGQQVVANLLNTIKKMTNITLFTNATLEKTSGSVGSFIAEVKVKDEVLSLNVGSVLVTTGFDFYQPVEGEYGYKKSEKVITLPDFKKLVESCTEKLIYNNEIIKSVAYVYCVGNRQTKGENKYCSRYCCTAAIHTSLQVHEKFKGVKAYHLYRDIRTYGKQELLYEKSSMQGDIYIKFEEKEPPIIDNNGKKPLIKVKDYLTSKKELTLEADLVVLVTGMVARNDSTEISGKLKIPIGSDKFFNEIHPKLKPVETVIKGVYIGGACQGPKNISESVQSALSGAAKINALIKSGTIALEPIVARINADACLWCGKCAEVCEYDSIKPIESNGKLIAEVNIATCKGCGICAPVCPSDAIEIAQFTNNEIESMIDGFTSKVEISTKESADDTDHEAIKAGMKEYPEIWNSILSVLDGKSLTIPQISAQLGLDKNQITYNLMTMNKYSVVEPAGLDDDETYFKYKLKK
ncbi:MAG: CoB--CoM heterodisulfide reductase iron-sulfur subunit A family protein [Tenuifilaceae bacterium]